MTKNEKIIMSILIVGILIFLILSAVLLFGKGKMEESTEKSVKSPAQRTNTKPYPTIPPIKDMTVMINERRLNPQIVTIKAGNLISFFNIGASTFTVEGADSNSTFLNFSVAQSDSHEIRFSNPGRYTYRIKEKPSLVGTIIIE